jgi:hypothetical protein
MWSLRSSMAPCLTADWRAPSNARWTPGVEGIPAHEPNARRVTRGTLREDRVRCIAGTIDRHPKLRQHARADAASLDQDAEQKVFGPHV